MPARKEYGAGHDRKNCEHVGNPHRPSAVSGSLASVGDPLTTKAMKRRRRAAPGPAQGPKKRLVFASPLRTAMPRCRRCQAAPHQSIRLGRPMRMRPRPNATITSTKMAIAITDSVMVGPSSEAFTSNSSSTADCAATADRHPGNGSRGRHRRSAPQEAAPNSSRCRTHSASGPREPRSICDEARPGGDRR